MKFKVLIIVFLDLRTPPSRFYDTFVTILLSSAIRLFNYISLMLDFKDHHTCSHKHIDIFLFEMRRLHARDGKSDSGS